MTIRRIPNFELPRNFKDWTGQMAIDAFGLLDSPDHPEFLRWRSATSSYPDHFVALIERMRQRLRVKFAGWNEVELMMHFVGPLLKLVDFGGRRYNMFFNRKMSSTIDGLKIGGTVDGVVALGYDDPIKPYFFLKEYKKSQGYDNDPFGQLLIAMVAAQQENDDRQAVYGCCVIGNLWRFALIDGQSVASTQSYDAADEGELQIVWSMLVEVKRIVEERVEMLTAESNP